MVSDGQTFTLSDGAHSLTFQFVGTGTVGSDNVAIDIRNTGSANVMACRICQAIQGSGLDITASGNGCPSTCSVTNATFTGGLVGMTGGTSNDCATGVGCIGGTDCASGICNLNQTCPGGVACGTCAVATMTKSAGHAPMA